MATFLQLFPIIRQKMMPYFITFHLAAVAGKTHITFIAAVTVDKVDDVEFIES